MEGRQTSNSNAAGTDEGKHMNNSLNMMAPVLDEEMEELEDFLLSEAVSDEAMSLVMLDGFLTALVIGPINPRLDDWLHRIWGSKENAPHFETMDQAQRIVGIIMRHMNGIIWSLQHDPDTFDPMFDTRKVMGDPKEYLDGEMWAYGCMEGVELYRKDWQALFDDPDASEALRPIWLLGADQVSPEEEALTATPAQREVLSLQIPAAVGTIYRYWLPMRKAIHERLVAATYQRENPKIGRNDPCPCGSGKKFKKCCGEAAALH